MALVEDGKTDFIQGGPWFGGRDPCNEVLQWEGEIGLYSKYHMDFITSEQSGGQWVENYSDEYQG